LLTFIESGCKLHERVGWSERAVSGMSNKLTGV